MNPDTYLAPIFNRFLDIIQRHANYLISCSSYVANIKSKKEELEATEADLNIKIEGARRKLQKLSNQNQVALWQEQVDAITHKIDEVVTKYETRACFCAIYSNYKTGHRCDDKIKEADKLIDQGSQYLKEEMVACDNSIISISQPYVVPGSLELNVAKALSYIQNDTSEVHVIGIWGLGGVGKTTLLTKIYNSCIGTNAMFKTLVWIVASKEQSSVTMIQQKIVEKLGLAKRDDVQSQAHIIHNFLKDGNFLLFIDDLWEAVELTEVGVPNPYEAECDKRRKVIFTTRLLDVCGNMEAKEPIKVNCLDWENSWLLFKQKVGDDNILSDYRVLKIAKDVVKECKGLPLALKTIGRAMSPKKDLYEWKSALDLIKKSQVHNVLGIKKDEMQHILKSSYDFLDDDVLKKCFLTISMWPEDHSIDKEELISCWMGLDIIDNFENMDEAYQSGHSLIGRLVAASLLEKDELLDHNHTHVKMHDILRDLALWIASDFGKNKWLVKAGIRLQDAPSIEVKWSEAECISLMYNRLRELPSSIPSCPHLLTLVLQYNELKCESVVSSFHKFQSLKYLNLSKNQLDSFPESICDLSMLQYLNLSYNQIKHIPDKFGNLKMLKYVILRENGIKNVPRGTFSGLTKLLILDLLNSVYSRAFPLAGVLEDLKCLEKKLIYFGIWVSGDEEFRELLRLRDLHIVTLRIENVLMTSFNFMSIIPKPYCLRELDVFDSSGLLEIIFEKNDTRQDHPSINLESLLLRDLFELERIIWKEIDPKKLFAELQNIDIYSCNLDDITWVIHLPSLRCLTITSCGNMRIAMKNENNDNNIYEAEPNILTFPSLTMLFFSDMVSLEKIFTGSLAFPKLDSLIILRCPLLKELPLEIESTPKMKEISGSQNWWDNLKWGDENSKFHFNQLYKNNG